MGKDNIYRYPIAPHLLSHWTRSERTGALELPLGATGRVLRVDYVQYKPPEYFLGQHFLGTVTLDGQPVRVVELYRHHSVTNSGHVRWKGRAASEEGLCAVSELIMAHDAKRELALREVEPGIWELGASLDVDQTFHEIEINSYRCAGRLDVGRRELTLERSYYRDAST